MEQKDAQLIQQVLQGDQEAFAILVNKYQKGVHALAWRKIGDFHIAQEITQDAFLRAYQKLETLKNHNLFGGWLYVIASRLCADWFEKKSLPEQSLEVTDMSEVNRGSYSRYVAQKQEAEADETRREVVKKLLQKLPESERTVMTLHYLGEMTIKTISEFLGVSPNTVKSRLSRARNRLKKEEDMIRQNLGSFQLPANLTEDIMQEVSRLVPAAPAANKPVLPWALSAASAVLIFLLIGVGAQYLSRFQKPYNLSATSEPTVDLIEALFVVDTPAKPAVRNQAGRSAIPGRNPGAGQQPNAQFFAAAAADETEVATPQLQWTQTKGPEGGIVNNFFTTDSGDIYAGTSTALYKLKDDRRAWRRVNARKVGSQSFQDWLANSAQMAAHGKMLYLATDTEILASEDNGETWQALGSHAKGIARGFVVTDSGFYLALTGGVYYSKDGKTSWVVLKDGMPAEEIRALAAIGNTVFAGTDKGLYRLNIERWKLLPVPVGPADMHGRRPAIHALAASKNRLYVAAGEASTNQSGTEIKSVRFWWTLHRSTDLGDSWYPIDPRGTQERETGRRRNQSSIGSPPSGADSIPLVKIVATGAWVTVTVADGEFFYSTNTGETWTTLEKDSLTYSIAPLLIADTNIFYKGGLSGILRTTDGGESWHPFNTGFVSTPVTTLIAVKGRLYANSMDLRYVTSTDGGESWTLLPRDIDHGALIAIFDDNVYLKRGNNMNSRSPLLRLSAENNSLNFIPGMPGFERRNQQNKVQAEIAVPEEMILKALQEILQESFPDKVKQNIEDLDLEQLIEMLKDLDIDPDQLSDQVTEKLKDNPDYTRLKKVALDKAFHEQPAADILSFYGSFAVSGDTYYIEYGQKLFRWEPGMTEWHDTGLIDETEFVFPNPDYSADLSTSINTPDSIGFKIAASGSTVYVGKRDGHLAQSFDKGETWNDITQDLPFSFAAFNAIDFAGSTLYVATDKGVAYSSDGTRWHSATDVEGRQLVMERLVAEGMTVYGTTGQYVYALKEGSNMWEQVTPEIPDTLLAFAVSGNVLYVGTSNSGVLRFTLEE